MFFKHLEIYPKEMTKQIHIVVCATWESYYSVVYIKKLEIVNSK